MASVSSSNWLDRLRSSRGFPTVDEPDLGRFLSSSGSAPTTTESTHSDSTQKNSGAACRKQQNPRFSGAEVSNVLCDLFNMGEKEETSRTFQKKKSSRKQENPRFFGANDQNNELCSSDDLRRDKGENGTLANSSGDNSLNENREKMIVGVEEIRDEDDDVDLKAYSRNEVFVIDTSLPEWKFDGWVFRKNDEWKIKEKKGKGRVCSANSRKRKLLSSSLKNNDNLDKDDSKKKMKMMKINDDGGQPRNEKNDQPFKETTDSLGKVPQKRCPCPRPPEKFGNEGSSVVLPKSIPLNNISEAPKLGKNSQKIPLNNISGAPRLGKSSQKKCPKKMKIL